MPEHNQEINISEIKQEMQMKIFNVFLPMQQLSGYDADQYDNKIEYVVANIEDYILKILEKVRLEVDKIKFNVDYKSEEYWNGKDNERAKKFVFDQPTLMHIFNNGVEQAKQDLDQKINKLKK